MLEARRRENSLVDAALAAEEMYFRGRLDSGNLLGYCNRRVNVPSRAAAGKVKTFSTGF
jgi:hypothetical protein